MLTTLMSHVPARCNVLLEDLNIAFKRSITCDLDSTGTPSGQEQGQGRRRHGLRGAAELVAEFLEPRHEPERWEYTLSIRPAQPAGRRPRLRGAHSLLDDEPPRAPRSCAKRPRANGRLGPVPEREQVAVGGALPHFLPLTEEESAMKDADMEKQLRGIVLPLRPCGSCRRR
ncbi:hypothetical protein FIBSPDRAFT_328408 [Athelia psychrophila]|uniref:Uncharacterized protein n=1 Tax=Athelia psychrophila TaxID=1759441 RepID=A0A166QDQ4_9AGAM|nr:hypothetical protein FIBSPDRAFT_328408 [Fibularhizoctonia sp. CBS 109695]